MRKRKYKHSIRKKKQRCCMYTEWHHIVPEYAGGTEADDNLVELTREEHATAHFLLWLQYHDERDWLAWRGLEGLIGKDDIFLEASSMGGKNSVKNKSGIHGQTKEEKSANGRKGAARGKELGVGIFGFTKEQKSEYGKMGAAKTVAEGLGIHGATPEKRSKWAKKAHAVMYAKNKETVDALLKKCSEVMHECPKCKNMFNTPNIDRHIKTCKVDPSHYWATNGEEDILVELNKSLPDGFRRGKKGLIGHMIKEACPDCGSLISKNNLSRHRGKKKCVMQSA